MAAVADLASSEGAAAAENTALLGERKLAVVNPNERKGKAYKRASEEHSMASDSKEDSCIPWTTLVLRVADTSAHLEDQHLVCIWRATKAAISRARRQNMES